MRVGIVGADWIGADMVRRLLGAGHECVVYDARNADEVRRLAADGAMGVMSLADMVALLHQPRTIWLMIPRAAVDAQVTTLIPLLDRGDIVIDGGDSHYRDDALRARELRSRGIYLVDVGAIGNLWGLERGNALMIGGDKDVVRQLDPIFSALVTGIDAAPRIAGRQATGSTARYGYLHCGPNGAGHFVKMVYDGIEYAIMAAYAEGLSVLRNANAGSGGRSTDFEPEPPSDSDRDRFEFDLADIAEVWWHGSATSSRLLDLIATILSQHPGSDGFEGHAFDASGSDQTRWAVAAAIDAGVPVPVLSAALFECLTSQGEMDFVSQLLSLVRHEVRGQVETYDIDPKGA